MSRTTLSERRRFVRARRKMWLQHKLHHRHHKPVHDRWHWAISCDMSVGGVLFMTSLLYHKGDVIDLRVTVAGTVDVLKGLARVVRVNKKSDETFAVAVALLFFENHKKG